ncbi:MAG TPA: hypothetical protein VHD56_02450 [Tepidisphaeraceae bacterium]|nr:hypothetical protein [Tepidisphaeraceae bacterium]
MDYDAATEIYRQIRETSLTDLRDDVVATAARYARLRVDWVLADVDGRMALESDRTNCHNSLIAACDILSRNMSRAGEDIAWRKLLGEDRKRIGDFACFLHALLGVSAR